MLLMRTPQKRKHNTKKLSMRPKGTLPGRKKYPPGKLYVRTTNTKGIESKSRTDQTTAVRLAPQQSKHTPKSITEAKPSQGKQLTRPSQKHHQIKKPRQEAMPSGQGSPGASRRNTVPHEVPDSDPVALGAPNRQASPRREKRKGVRCDRTRTQPHKNLRRIYLSHSVYQPKWRPAPAGSIPRKTLTHSKRHDQPAHRPQTMADH